MEERRIEIEPVSLMRDLLEHWWLILMGILSGAMLAYVIAGVTYVPRYTSTATFAVTTESNPNAWNSQVHESDMTTALGNIMQSKVMKKIVNEKLGKEKMSAEIRTEIPEETNLLVLKVTDKTPQDSIDQMTMLMSCYDEITRNAIDDAKIDVLSEPQIPLEPDNPLSLGGAAVKGAIVGLLLSILILGVVSGMSDTLKREEDITKKLDAKNMGRIPFERREKTFRDHFIKKKSALLINNPLMSFGFVEAYKKLAVKIDYQMTKENSKILLVTSVHENEGKSTVAANLAISLAEQSKKVLLIDGDLRKPSQFLIFGMAPSDKEGFGEFLKKGQMEDVLKKSSIPNLYLALDKKSYPASAEMLKSRRLTDFLKHCRNYMDYVIIDSPPAGVIGDAEILASQSDAVLLVAKQNEILAEDINDVLDGLRKHHSRVFGVVLNAVYSIGGFSENGRRGEGAYGNYSKSRGK